MAMARRPRSVTAATTLSAVGGARDRLLLRAGLLAGCSASFKLTSLPVIPALLLTIALCCLFTADAHDPRNTGADEHHAAATRLRSPFAAMGDPAAGVHACPGGCPSDAEGRSPSTAGSRQSLTPAWSVASRRAWPALRAGVLFGVAALLPLAPWLLKNLYFFGHIFYALAVQVSNPSQGTAIAATSPPPAEHLRWIVITFGDMLWNHMGALSAVLLLAPFLLRRPGQRAAQVFFLAGSLLWLLFVPFFEPPRYYMGLIAVGQALTAGVVGDIMRRLRRPQLADLAVAAYLLVACVPGLVAGLSFLGNPLLQRVALGAVSRREYLITHLPAYQAEEYADARLPRGAVVALVNVPSGYYMDRQHVNDWYGSTLAALQAGAASRRAVFAGWCKAGVGYAVFDRGSGSLDDNSRADVRPRGAFPWLATPGLDPRLIYTARGVDVLAIHPCLGRRLP